MDVGAKNGFCEFCRGGHRGVWNEKRGMTRESGRGRRRNFQHKQQRYCNRDNPGGGGLGGGPKRVKMRPGSPSAHSINTSKSN